LARKSPFHGAVTFGPSPLWEVFLVLRKNPLFWDFPLQFFRPAWLPPFHKKIHFPELPRRPPRGAVSPGIWIGEIGPPVFLKLRSVPSSRSSRGVPFHDQYFLRFFVSSHGFLFLSPPISTVTIKCFPPRSNAALFPPHPPPRPVPLLDDALQTMWRVTTPLPLVVHIRAHDAAPFENTQQFVGPILSCQTAPPHCFPPPGPRKYTFPSPPPVLPAPNFQFDRPDYDLPRFIFEILFLKSYFDPITLFVSTRWCPPRPGTPGSSSNLELSPINLPVSSPALVFQGPFRYVNRFALVWGFTQPGPFLNRVCPALTREENAQQEFINQRGAPIRFAALCPPNPFAGRPAPSSPAKAAAPP